MDSRRSLAAAALGTLALVTALSSGCSSPEPRAADNLLFVSFDTTRADRLSAYGYDQPTSPNLAAMAERGVLFERAFTTVPSTLSAHTTMFTGLLPPLHGVRCNGWYRVPLQHDTLAERLKRRGFATAAVIGALPLDNRFGLDQGFGSYDAAFARSASEAKPAPGLMDAPGNWLTHDYNDFERSADQVSELAIRWLDRRGAGERWFLFAHYFDPHWPYEPVSPYKEEFESVYDAEIAFMDEHFGRLIDHVRTLPGKTLIVVTSDHGEGLGDHGEKLHNRYLYNSTLHVPLVIELDGVAKAGGRVAENVNHMDLLPTLLELLGVKAREGESFAGRSLAAALTGAEPEPRALYAETLVHKLEHPRGVSVRALIDGDHKWIDTEIEPGFSYLGPRRELYDFAGDPGELANLAHAPKDTPGQGLADQLSAMKERLEGGAFPPERIPLDEGTQARLRALGYL